MFYDNYIRLCNSVNKTPSAVAVEMGISKTSVNRWKNGSFPTDATMSRIANYFGVTIEELSKGKLNERTAPSDGVSNGKYVKKETPTPENGSERVYTDAELTDAFMRADEATRAAIRLLLKLK